ncbi:MAG: tetratricopeptide repeat protein [Rhodocyclaceae bacterium]|nr:tetratricopeptide repeat protein [Rhodocyclaceae bacterium]
MANGNLNAAREHYQEALKSDQRSRDALLGLAVTALREGRREEAARRYEQMLGLDPRDPDANAGIALLHGAVDPVGHESRLKAVLAERGDNAALHHALGSLLARQHRWGEAQEAFFRAVTLAPQSADYQFNLAVSLDHLGQYTQARIYYRKALGFSAPGSSTFDREAVQSRIAAIDALSP